jgi:hypothetical protein
MKIEQKPVDQSVPIRGKSNKIEPQKSQHSENSIRKPNNPKPVIKNS